MNDQKIYMVTIIDPFKEVHEIAFNRYEYPSLMELIVNSYFEEIGDCKGRAWCGTCHVKELTKDAVGESISKEEIETLNKLDERDASSRLACQILLTENIHNKTFKIINES